MKVEPAQIYYYLGTSESPNNDIYLKSSNLNLIKIILIKIIF